MIGQRRLKGVDGAGRNKRRITKWWGTTPHKRVKATECQQPETNLLSIDFQSDIEDEILPMAEAIGSGMVGRTRGAHPANGCGIHLCKIARRQKKAT
jgi:hypothetical protein